MLHKPEETAQITSLKLDFVGVCHYIVCDTVILNLAFSLLLKYWILTLLAPKIRTNAAALTF